MIFASSELSSGRGGVTGSAELVRFSPAPASRAASFAFDEGKLPLDFKSCSRIFASWGKGVLEISGVGGATEGDWGALDIAGALLEDGAGGRYGGRGAQLAATNTAAATTMILHGRRAKSFAAHGGFFN